jgi:glycosidase
MPGIPCVYCGSEWGEKAEKKQGDLALRPSFEKPQSNGLTQWIRALARIRAENPALRQGGYRQLYLTNRQFAFERELGGSRVIVAVNLEPAAHETSVLPTSGRMYDLVAGKYAEFGGRLSLKPNSATFFRCD